VTGSRPYSPLLCEQQLVSCEAVNDKKGERGHHHQGHALLRCRYCSQPSRRANRIARTRQWRSPAARHRRQRRPERLVDAAEGATVRIAQVRRDFGHNRGGKWRRGGQFRGDHLSRRFLSKIRSNFRMWEINTVSESFQDLCKAVPFVMDFCRSYTSFKIKSKHFVENVFFCERKYGTVPYVMFCLALGSYDVGSYLSIYITLPSIP
jgi:hypothetical protein